MITHISIIIPIYNVELYIEECLQSVANQTITEGVECILVDDCGTDNSMEIAEGFISSYNGMIDFRIFHHAKNKGLSAARNSGISKAKGKYLFFLDSDDAIDPNCLNIMFDAAEKYDADLVQGSYVSDVPYMEQFSRQSLPLFSDNHPFIKKTLLDYDVNPVMAQNRLVKKSIIEDNNLFFKEGIIHEDNYWTFFLAKYVKRMAFCPKKLYYYRITPGSITNKIDKERETSAFATMVNDFSENIDSFYKGAQKRYIFLHLLTMKNNHYYSDSKELKRLFNIFNCQCTYLERFLMLLIFNSKGYFQAKVINLLQRVFLMK